MENTKKLLAVVFLIVSSILLSGCDLSSVENGIQRYLNGNQNAINEAEQVGDQIIDYNPVFESEEEITAKNAVAKAIDDFSQRALSRVFIDVKMVAGGDTDSTPFILKYVVKRRINQEDGDALYQELLKEETRVKEGGSPGNFLERNTVEMSVYKDIGGRSYIITVVIDLAEQIIWINVY